MKYTGRQVDLTLQPGDTVRSLILYKDGQGSDLFRVYADGRIEVYGEPSTKTLALNALDGLEESLRAMREIVNAQPEQR